MIKRQLLRGQMFTKPEIMLVSQPYFKMIRQTDEFLEIQSVCTGHYWIVKKNLSKHGVTLYHKYTV